MPTAVELPDGISALQIDTWYDRFRFYRHPPSREEIVAWIYQFDDCHHLLAAKLLDNVSVMSDMDIHAGYHEALSSLPGWSKRSDRRKGRWAFVGLGGQAESGPAMLHMFREANKLTSDRYQDLFVSLSDLPRMQLNAEDTVVFVDDFSGTGDQFVKRWATFQELVSSEAKVYLFLAAATSHAVDRLTNLEELTVISARVLPPSANVLSDDNTVFDSEEKIRIHAYCVRADRFKPSGWGNCGLLFVISRKTPNNSLPILRVNERRWRGIFPRQLRPGQARAAA